MPTTVTLDSIYVPSEDIVAREIEGELLIVPLVAGIGDLEDELFSLNTTGQAIWQRLDGQRSLRAVVDDLRAEYAASAGAPTDAIEADVLGLVGELVGRNILRARQP